MRQLVLIIIPFLLTPTLAFAHPNYTQSKGCLAPGNYWYNNICRHGQPPKLVAVTGPSRCYNTKEGERCESGGWIPVH